MKTEAEIREELFYRRKLLAKSMAAMQPHLGVVDNESAVLILEWILSPNVEPRGKPEGENSLGWLWWKLKLYRLFPGYRIGGAS